MTTHGLRHKFNNLLDKVVRNYSILRFGKSMHNLLDAERLVTMHMKLNHGYGNLIKSEIIKYNILLSYKDNIEVASSIL